jgi:putative protein-disulfide isomerase
MKAMVYYCYDAYCGWCYGFSPVISKLARKYAQILEIEVLSGGMILPEPARSISVTAPYLQQEYISVEQTTGVKFGEDYLWHIFNPDKSDWFPSSEKAAIALCVFKEYYPDRQPEFASDLQYSLHYEGRDLCDDEAYRHLVEKYDLPEADFYTRLRSDNYKEKAYYEFALVKQLQVTGFPTVLLQENKNRFYLLARGYTDYSSLEENVKRRLQQISIGDGG